MVEHLTQLITEQARLRPKAEAVSDPELTLTYGELDWQVRCVAHGLRSEGLQPGERVVLALPNGVAFIVAHFGILAAGGISVPCEPGISEANLEAVSSSCQPRVVLRESVDVLEKWIQQGKAGDIHISGQAEDIAALMYTTGTTGKPKGVMLTHANVLSALRNITQFVSYTQDDREVVVLPLSHNFGLGHVYCNLLSGGAVYTEPGLTRVGRVLNKIESWGATGFPGTPLGFAMLADRYREVFRQKASNLRF
ncbi:MAG: AMP-binding protein, partial [Verrucomicrobiota bacterium]